MGNACFLAGDDSCGPYSYPAISPSNGFNTYVANQINQLNFGWEICSTGGVPEKFQVTNYSLTATSK